MGEVINLNVTRERRVVVCGCEGMMFMLLADGDVFCPGCGYILSNLSWNQKDDQDTEKPEVP